MRKIVFFVLLFASCQSSSDKAANQPINPVNQAISPVNRLVDPASQKQAIGSMLDSFNLAAANADYNGYFGFYTDSAVFIGTDATEYWKKPEFMAWAKPAFDSKKTWHFKAIKRNIYFGSDPGLAWFDELLNTKMKICRGSGVVVKQGDKWKVQEYVLSMTIPNERIRDALKAKAPIEDSLIKAWR